MSHLFYRDVGLEIRFTNRVMFTSAYVDPVTLRADQFRWSQPEKECYKSLWIKYPGEYYESSKFCHRELCSSTRIAKILPVVKQKPGSQTINVQVLARAKGAKDCSINLFLGFSALLMAFLNEGSLKN